MLAKLSKKDIFFTTVILFSGMALPIFRSQEGLILLFAIGLLIFKESTNFLNKKLLLALAIWITFFTINTFIIQSFHPFFMATYLAKIMIAYWLIKHYKFYIFKKFEDVIYGLTVISLVFYTIQVLSPSLVYNLFSSINLSGDLFPNIPYSSIGVYTFHQKDLFELFPRNAGFSWEPGPFSSYIGLALFINVARHGVNFKDRKRLLIFSIAIITTQSTTGLLILMAILFWYAWAHYDNKIIRFFSIPFTLSIGLYLFFNVPWLQEKMLIDSQQNLEEILHHAEITGESYAPGRSVGLLLRWEDFKNYPIAGFGGNVKLQYGYIDEGNVVAAINGLGNILGRYGAIGSILFLILLIKTGKLISSRFKYIGYLIFPILILILGFSFGIVETPILITLIMTPVFLKK